MVSMRSCRLRVGEMGASRTDVEKSLDTSRNKSAAIVFRNSLLQRIQVVQCDLRNLFWLAGIHELKFDTHAHKIIKLTKGKID